jgi:hypothetical protein
LSGRCFAAGVWWAGCAPGHRTKTLDHPQAGALRLNCDVLLVPEDDQEVVLMTADPGSPAVRALRRLATQAT